MNEVGQELLVHAALTGTRQIKGKYKDYENGFCALGVLLEPFQPCHYEGVLPLLQHYYGISPTECASIKAANDRLEWDFLTIARKFGSDGATTSTL